MARRTPVQTTDIREAILSFGVGQALGPLGWRERAKALFKPPSKNASFDICLFIIVSNIFDTIEEDRNFGKTRPQIQDYRIPDLVFVLCLYFSLGALCGGGLDIGSMAALKIKFMTITLTASERERVIEAAHKAFTIIINEREGSPAFEWQQSLTGLVNLYVLQHNQPEDVTSKNLSMFAPMFQTLNDAID